MSIFEAVMLICFGAAWPFSIYRSYRSRSIEGKSLLFLLVLLLGYLAGILHKVFYHFDYVIILYCVNFIMVAIDTGLYARNYRIKMKETGLKRTVINEKDEDSG